MRRIRLAVGALVAAVLGAGLVAPVTIEVDLVGRATAGPEVGAAPTPTPTPGDAPSSPPADDQGSDPETDDEDLGGQLVPAVIGVLAVVAGVIGLGWLAMRRRAR